MNVHISKRTLGYVLAAAGAVVLAVAIWLTLFGGPSVNERVSDDVGSKARCREAGKQVLAGERETVYTCTYRSATLKDHPITSSCVAIVDGRVYGVSVDPC